MSLLEGNFDTVVAGEVYRSAQPSRSDIQQAKDHFGVKTIINLRGADPKADWYQEEIKAASDFGITHISVGLSAEHEPNAGQMHKLMHLLASVEKPVLIHCKAGADRTGLVAAMYLYLNERMSSEIAGQQLSFKFGHVGAFGFSKTHAMDRTWEKVMNNHYTQSNHEWDLVAEQTIPSIQSKTLDLGAFELPHNHSATKLY